MGQNGITIEAEIATYDKKANIVDAKKSVKVVDTKTKDLLTSDRIRYLKNKEEILEILKSFLKSTNKQTCYTY